MLYTIVDSSYVRVEKNTLALTLYFQEFPGVCYTRMTVLKKKTGKWSHELNMVNGKYSSTCMKQAVDCNGRPYLTEM